MVQSAARHYPKYRHRANRSTWLQAVWLSFKKVLGINICSYQNNIILFGGVTWILISRDTTGKIYCVSKCTNLNTNNIISVKVWPTTGSNMEQSFHSVNMVLGLPPSPLSAFMSNFFRIKVKPHSYTGCINNIKVSQILLQEYMSITDNIFLHFTALLQNFTIFWC